jgi:hypothetical protein
MVVAVVGAETRSGAGSGTMILGLAKAAEAHRMRTSDLEHRLLKHNPVNLWKPTT